MLLDSKDAAKECREPFNHEGFKRPFQASRCPTKVFIISACI